MWQKTNGLSQAGYDARRTYFSEPDGSGSVTPRTDRAFIVSDVIRGEGLGPGEYSIGDQRVVVDENLATSAADRSHGSAGTMPRSAENLRGNLGLDEAAVCRVLVENRRNLVAG